MSKVKAVWKGPSGHRLPDGTLLEQDVTVAEVGEFELESDNWEAVEPPAKARTGKGDS